MAFLGKAGLLGEHPRQHAADGVGDDLSRSQLLDRVWGIDFEGGDRAVDGRIKALRAALGPAGKQIKTVFKAGYKLEEGAS